MVVWERLLAEERTILRFLKQGSMQLTWPEGLPQREPLSLLAAAAALHRIRQAYYSLLCQLWVRSIADLANLVCLNSKMLEVEGDSTMNHCYGSGRTPASSP